MQTLRVSFNEMSVQIKKSSKLKDSLNWIGEIVREVLEVLTQKQDGRVKHASFSQR